MNRSLFIIFLLWTSGTRAELMFGVRSIADGAYIPSFKEKYSVKRITEDSLVTTPEVVSLADGLSNPQFHSGFLAEYLTKLGTAYTITQVQTGKVPPNPNDGYRSVFAQALTGIESGYFRTVDEALAAYPGGAPSEEIVSELNGVGSTLAIAFIERQESVTLLNVIQRGDTCVIVFRPTPSKSNPGKFYYRPIFFSREQQHAFNTPFHFGWNSGSVAEELYVDSVIIKAGDIAFIASDGVLDNLHINYISYAFNHIVAAAQTPRSGSQIVEELETLISFYHTTHGKVNPDAWPRGEKTELQKPQPHFRAVPSSNPRRLSRRYEKTEVPVQQPLSSRFLDGVRNMFSCFFRERELKDPSHAPIKRSEAMQKAIKELEELIQKRNEQLDPKNRNRQAKVKIDKLIGADEDEEDLWNPRNRISKPSPRNFDDEDDLPVDIKKLYEEIVPNMVERDTNRDIIRPTVDSALGPGTTQVEISETLKKKNPFYRNLEREIAEAIQKKVEESDRKSTASTRFTQALSQDFSDDEVETGPLGQSSPQTLFQSLLADSQESLEEPVWEIKSAAQKMEASNQKQQKEEQKEEEEEEEEKPFHPILDQEDPEMDEFEANLTESMFTLRTEGAVQVFQEAAENAVDELFGPARAHGESNDILGPTFTTFLDKHFDFAPNEFQVFADKFNPVEVSSIIATLAKKFSACTECLVPFRANAYRWGQKRGLGGKRDDISVVAQIVLDYIPPSAALLGRFTNNIRSRIAKVDEALKAHVDLFLDFQERLYRIKRTKLKI